MIRLLWNILARLRHRRYTVRYVSVYDFSWRGYVQGKHQKMDERRL